MKRLYRSRKDRMIAGVAGGLAEYFDVDPTIIRLVWALLLIPGGLPGLLPYIVCWIIIPEEPLAAGSQPQLTAATRPAETPAPGTSASLPDVTPPAPPAATDGEQPQR
jgi:phage shock protein PspC (stress-responsive transcriptional regulator)